MSYFAAAATRGPRGWTAAELDLTGAADVEEIAERLRDSDLTADVSLLFVESDDTYLVILRLDGGEDLRIFGSDAVFAEESRLGALLLGDLEVAPLELDELPAAGPDQDDEEPPASTDIDPLGDADLLADLGVPAAKLLALCAHEGMLPADVTAEVCQVLGCGDAVEELREG